MNVGTDRNYLLMIVQVILRWKIRSVSMLCKATCLHQLFGATQTQLNGLVVIDLALVTFCKYRKRRNFRWGLIFVGKLPHEN